MVDEAGYGQRIDAVVRSPAAGDLSAEDWRELAIAALDQAGLTARQQEIVRELVEGWAK